MDHARQLREEAPGIGAYKMFIILKDIFLDVMPGRDRFYKIITENGLMLKPEQLNRYTQHFYCEIQKVLSTFKSESYKTDSCVIYRIYKP